jgi:hypothetical protein
LSWFGNVVVVLFTEMCPGRKVNLASLTPAIGEKWISGLVNEELKEVFRLIISPQPQDLPWGSIFM